MTEASRVEPFRVGPLDAVAADAIAGWRYPESYAAYDFPGIAAELLDPANRYVAVRRGADLWGYACYATEARVPGGDYRVGEPEVLDIGVGMGPGRIGAGHGSAFLGAVLEHALSELRPTQFRLTVAEWNERATRLVLGLRFTRSHRFIKTGTDTAFWQYQRVADMSGR